MREIKMSILRDDLLLINDVGTLLTVQEIKEARKEGEVESKLNGEIFYLESEIENMNWYIAEKDTFGVEGFYVVKGIFENATASTDSPGWYQKAMDALREKIDYESIEKLLMDEFSKVDGLTEFYIKGAKVNIEK